MSRMKARIEIVLLPLIALAGCHASSEPPITAAHAALRAADTPAPQLRSVPEHWTGSVTQLFVADAAASCAFVADGTVFDDSLNGWSDEYLAQVADRMRGSLCPYEAGPDGGNANLSMINDWIYERSQLSCEQPNTLAPNMGPNGAPAIEPTTIPWPSGLAMSDTGAGEAIRWAPFNLCLAQKLREISPGAASGEALLLSGADQRELLEVIRERTQIAMLQYATLAVAFAPHADLSGANADPQTYQLRDWAQANQQQLTRMGVDFAAALQLDVDVAAETVQLFGRSASARLARGGSAVGADDAWGPGSWRERTMAVLYGGDPLAQAADGTSPWQHPWGKTTPGEQLPTVRAGIDLNPLTGPVNWDWPTLYEAPYVRDSITDPGVGDLLRLAQGFDLLNLKLLALPKKFFHCTQQIDRATSADYLYRALEAAIRTRDCDSFTTDANGKITCQPVSVAAVGASSNYGNFDLYLKHGLTPAHATELMTQLDDKIANLCPYPAQTPAPPYSGAFPTGALDLQGTITVASNVDGNPGSWWHISSDARFQIKQLSEVEGLYTRYARFRAPDYIDDTVPLYEQGLLSTGRTDESKRLMGAVSALSATRELIENAAAQGPGDSSVAAYLQLRPAMQSTIDGAVGGTAVSFLARAYAYQNPTTGTGELAQSMGDASTGALMYEVVIDVSPEDSWWDPTQASSYSLIAVPNNLVAAASARFANTKYAEAPSPTLNAVSASFLRTVTTSGLNANRTRWSFNISLPSRDLWTFVARHGSDTRLVTGYVNLSGFTQSLAAGAAGDSNRAIEGQYQSFDGTLNALGQRISAADDFDPSQPAWDGFGYPAHYVPPFDASLLNGQPGDTTVAAELRKADSDASSAVTQLGTAVQDMLTIAKDDQTRKANAEQAVVKIQDDLINLCGTGTTCDTSMSDFKVDFTSQWTRPVPSCPLGWRQLDGSGQPTQVDAETYMDCTVYGYIQSVSMTVSLSNVVIAHKDDPTVPPFIEFQGGTLKESLADQWTALRTLRDLSAALTSTRGSLDGKLSVAGAEAQVAGERVDDECGAGAMMLAQQAGSTLSFPPSWSPGPMIAQEDKCNEMTEDQAPANAGLYSALMDAFSTLSGQLTQFTAGAKALQDASASAAQDIMAARLAVSRDALEQAIGDLSPNLQTSFGLYRTYTNYDVFRAKGLLEQARMSALLARRAIEARYVVDLSTMSQTEPEVAAPQTWADDVYGYELDVPAAIGMTVGTQAPGAIYPYGIVDYVHNLEDFVNGYTITRPTATGGTDTNVIFLPGPIPTTTGITPPGTYSWSFFCWTGPLPNDGTWMPLPASNNLAGACGGGVTPVRARIDFSLDPWGRIDQGIAQPPLTHNYNMRWNKVAVNLVGTAVHDCTNDSSPACLQSPFVSYDLQQMGPAWITDYNQAWWNLAVPIGFIEGAKGVADELLVDYSYWSNPYISNAVRSEYIDRPLGGSYELDLNIDRDPDVFLQNLQGVQLLYTFSFWSKQQ